MRMIIGSFLQKRWNETEAWEKITLGVFLLSFFLVFQMFLPNMGQINPWDEADYVNGGKFFAEGQWPPLSWSPLTAFFYGTLYLLLQEAPFWFLQSITIGRITIYILLWLSAYLIAKNFSAVINPFIIIGISFVAPLFTDILGNPSDAFFASMSGLAFGQFLSFYNRGKYINLALLSTFLGLAALTRNDGLILSFCVLPVGLLIIKQKRLSFIPSVSALLLPFIILVFGYLLLYWAFRGTFEIGTGGRSYIAFLQGHQIIYEKEEACPYNFQKCAVLDATKKFGSAEENNHSVIRAILNNPTAFFPRIIKMLTTLPTSFFDAYGRQFSYILLFAAVLGIIYLVYLRQYFMIFALLIWSSYLGVYFLTFFRPGYLQTSFHILFTLSAFGVTLLLQSLKNNFFYFILAVTFAIVLAGVQLDMPSFYFNFGILIFVLFLGRFIITNNKATPEIATNTFLFLIFLSSIIIRGNTYPVITGREFAQSPEEQAMLVMQSEFKKNSLIAAGARGVVQAANMRYFSLGDMLEISSSEVLYEQLVASKVQGIYVDHNLSSYNQNVWRLIENDLGTKYAILYSGRQNSILVLKLNP